MDSPLICDVYEKDVDGKPDIAGLVNTGPPWHGIILKATQGDYYTGGEWFKKYWPMARSEAADRYGQDWFRGCYHYLDLTIDAVKQAQHYLRIVERAGGWGPGDLWPIVDVEQSHNPEKPGAARIVENVTAFAAHVEAETGRKPMLYGNMYLAENQVKGHMGCQLLWVARYTPKLPAEIYERIGWSLSELWAWQYSGDGKGALAGYPTMSPLGKVDISALTIAGGKDAAIKWTREHLFAEEPTS